MTDQSFCPGCGARWAPGAAFCASCGHGSGAAGAGPTLTQSVASMSIEMEKMRLRLLPFRLAGMAIGAAVGWIASGIYTHDLVLLQAGAALLAAFPGVWLGGIAGLNAVRG